MAILTLMCALLHVSLGQLPVTNEQKIGQLFVVRAYATGNESDLNNLISTIEQYQIGGILWMQGDPQIQRDWIERCQQASNVFLLMMQDLEWGMRMRFESGKEYPRAPELGLLSSDEIREIAYAIGLQCREVGIHLNLAPVVDVDVSEGNAYISSRCFSSDPNVCASAGVAYFEGIRLAGVLSCAKHFPGHGATQSDSHRESAAISGPLEPHLMPFRALIAAGIPVIMVGHLSMPGLNDHEPATLSAPVVTELLRSQLGFSGVILTDSLRMKAVSQSRSSEEVALLALRAGCDLLLDLSDLPRSWEAVSLAAREDPEFAASLDSKVQRLLTLKEQLTETLR